MSGNSTDSIYYDDIAVLWRQGRWAELWPSIDMTTPERVNAIVRFSLYTGLILYVVRKGDDRYLLYAMTAVALVTLAYRFHVKRVGTAAHDDSPDEAFAVDDREQTAPQEISADEPTYLCQPPTFDNPFANLLPTDLETNPNRPPACKYDDVKGDIKRTFDDQQFRDVRDVYRNSSRNFYSMPVTQASPDYDEFIKFCYSDVLHSRKNQYVPPW